MKQADIPKTWYRGDTAIMKYGIGGVDLTGAEVLIQLRRSTEATVVISSATVGTVTKTWSQINDETVIEWIVPSSVTQGLSAGYIYDVQTTLGGIVTTWIKGTINIASDVSR